MNAPSPWAKFLEEERKDWKAYYKTLRANHKLGQSTGLAVVVHWIDVVDVLTRNTQFVVPYAPVMDPAVGPFMLARDGAVENWRDKSLMRSLLSFDDLPKIRALAGSVAKAVLDDRRAAGAKQIDVVKEISRLVPLRMVQDYFGFKAPDEKMYEWSRKTQHAFFRNPTLDKAVEAEGVKAGKEMQAWLQASWATLAQNAKNGTDDVVSRLMRATGDGGSILTQQQVVSNVCGLLVGSIETTSHAIVNATNRILRDAAIGKAAVDAIAAGDKAGFDGIVWEALRFDPIGTYLVRIAKQDTTLSPGTDREIRVPPGTRVVVAVGAAMFDEAVFPAPDAFDPNRPRNLYLHMCLGPHECLGRHIAEQIVPETIWHLLQSPANKNLPGIGLFSCDRSEIDRNTPFPDKFEVQLI